MSTNKSSKHTRRHSRKSIRLAGYDYTRKGYYFVTICVKDREHLFGHIDNGRMRLNEYGEIVVEKWRWLAHQYSYIELDEWIVMPNHVHGILRIVDIPRRGDGSRPRSRGGSRPAPTISTDSPKSASPRHAPDGKINAGNEHDAPSPIKIKPIGQIVGAFKTVSAKQINIMRNTQGVLIWQRDFYDRIGRNKKELDRIRQYIRSNPAHWNNDDENPDRKSPRYVAMPDPQRQS